MADKNVSVELTPLLRVTWPDGQVAIFRQEELAQLLQTLLNEGLLALQGREHGQVLRELDLELGELADGTLVIRPSNPARLGDLLV